MPLTVRKFAHRLNMGKMLSSRQRFQFFFRLASILHIKRTGIKSRPVLLWAESGCSLRTYMPLTVRKFAHRLNMGKM